MLVSSQLSSMIIYEQSVDVAQHDSWGSCLLCTMGPKLTRVKAHLIYATQRVT